MKTRLIEIWVGIFVVLGISSLLMLALQVSGLSDFYQEDSGYELKAEFQNIGGLKPRSKVTIGGVTVGRVIQINLQPDGFQGYSAIVTMSIDKAIKIPDDSLMKILTAGLLGDNYIGVVPGESDFHFKEGMTVTMTSSAILLEDLISKFAVGEKK